MSVKSPNIRFIKYKGMLFRSGKDLGNYLKINITFACRIKYYGREENRYAISRVCIPREDLPKYEGLIYENEKNA